MAEEENGTAAAPEAAPEETPKEALERQLKERGKDRKQMAERRAKRTRSGGSWTLNGGNLDKNGNDRRMGTGGK